MKKIALYILSFLLISIPVAVYAQSASPTVLLSLKPLSVSVGQTIIVPVVISTNTPVNVADIQIAYPRNLVVPVALSSKDSIISIWLNQEWQSKNGLIHLYGGMTTAFSGKHGQIALITFEVIKSGQAKVSVKSAVFNASDGVGTSISGQLSSVDITGIQQEAAPAIEAVSTAPQVVPQKVIQAALSTPKVDVLPYTISDKDTLFITGEESAQNSIVQVSLENIQTGNVTTSNVQVTNDGKWFYKYPDALVPGQYVISAQATMGTQRSSVSSSQLITVSKVLFQYGSLRLTYDMIHGSSAAFLLIALILLMCICIFIVMHFLKKEHGIKDKVHTAEDVLKKSIGILKDDIDDLSALTKKAKLSDELTKEKIQLEEEKIEKDLSVASKDVSDAVSEITK